MKNGERLRMKRTDRFGSTMAGLIRCPFLTAALASAVAIFLVSPTLAAGPEVLRITDELIKAAKAEGSVIVRHGSPVYQMDAIARAFSKQYGIKVDLDRRAGSLGGQQFLMEERAGRHIVDVWISSDYAGSVMAHREGFLLSYKFPDDKIFVDGTYDEGWGYGAHITKCVTAYNPKLLPHAEANRLLKTWRGLLDPSLKGKIGLTDPAGSRITFGTNLMLYLRPEYGRDFFVKLAAQNPRLYPGEAPGSEDLQAGAIAVFLPLGEGIARQQFMRGSQIAWTYPEISATGSNRQHISKNAPHPNAARLYAQYMTTPEGVHVLINAGNDPTLKVYKDTRESTPKLKQTDWWKPYPEETSWWPDMDYWEKNYARLVKDMRDVLGWKK